MDFSGFYEFPFPAALSATDEKVRDFFFALPEEKQLKLLNGCDSYETFHDRVEDQMKKV